MLYLLHIEGKVGVRVVDIGMLCVGIVASSVDGNVCDIVSGDGGVRVVVYVVVIVSVVGGRAIVTIGVVCWCK